MFQFKTAIFVLLEDQHFFYSIGLGGSAHGKVTKTVHKTLTGGGRGKGIGVGIYGKD